MCTRQYAKYKCPRCAVAYCSLPCYRSHSGGARSARLAFPPPRRSAARCRVATAMAGPALFARLDLPLACRMLRELLPRGGDARAPRDDGDDDAAQRDALDAQAVRGRPPTPRAAPKPRPIPQRPGMPRPDGSCFGSAVRRRRRRSKRGTVLKGARRCSKRGEARFRGGGAGSVQLLRASVAFRLAPASPQANTRAEARLTLTLEGARMRRRRRLGGLSAAARGDGW